MFTVDVKQQINNNNNPTGASLIDVVTHYLILSQAALHTAILINIHCCQVTTGEGTVVVDGLSAEEDGSAMAATQNILGIGECKIPSWFLWCLELQIGYSFIHIVRASWFHTHAVCGQIFYESI